MKIECCICMEECCVGTDSNILLPKCGHWFHDVCINRWIDVNNSCPQCRVSVTRHELFLYMVEKIVEKVEKLREQCQNLKEEYQKLLEKRRKMME